MSRIIGIDLGTTNSVAAYMTAEGPKIIPNALGEALTPSVVAVDLAGKLLVGAAAKEEQVLRPERCASVFKRLMGTGESKTIAGKSFTPEELSGFVLKSLKEDAEAFFNEPVDRAVITVPAYFNDQQRKATIAAGRIAGFHVERILNEPTAAAIAYGFHESEEEKTLLIFDLGGGTFDVSIVEFFGGTLEVRASSGESALGGEDFTRTLVGRILELHGLKFERAEMDSPQRVSRLMQLCEQAKCRLSTQESVIVKLPAKNGDLAEDSPTSTITREQMRTWLTHTLARLELPIRRVLGDSKLTRSEINETILVGGATRMPAVVDAVTQMMGKPPHRRLNPDEVVGLGAAVQAGLQARDEAVKDLVVTDVAPFTLGIEIAKQIGSNYENGYFMPILERNTVLPASKIKEVSTLQPNQTTIKVSVYQGESRKVEGNLKIGEFEVSGIPRGPAGQMVSIRFTYDLNGVLQAEATIDATRQTVSHLITRYAKGLSKAQIADAVARMEALKTHPREDAKNRYLLKRAERVYQELAFDLRDQLGILLDGFEGALGLQDDIAIESHRAALEQFLSAYDPEMNRPHDDDEESRDADA